MICRTHRAAPKTCLSVCEVGGNLFRARGDAAQLCAPLAIGLGGSRCRRCGHLCAVAQIVQFVCQQQRITSIKSIGGQSGEARLLMLAALLLADELHDLRSGPKAAAAPAPAAAGADGERRAKLRRVAARAEEIAADLTDA